MKENEEMPLAAPVPTPTRRGVRTVRQPRTHASRFSLLCLVGLSLAGAWSEGTVAAGSNPLKRCLEPVASLSGALIDPANNYYDNTRVWIDVASQKQRIDIRIFNPNPLNTTVLLRHDLGIGYQFDDNGANCFSFFLSTGLDQTCLSEDSFASGAPVLGGRRFKEITDTAIDGNRRVWTVRERGAPRGFCPDLDASASCRRIVPISLKTLDPAGLLVSSQEFRDQTTGIEDPAVFDVPVSCPPPAP